MRGNRYSVFGMEEKEANEHTSFLTEGRAVVILQMLFLGVFIKI